MARKYTKMEELTEAIRARKARVETNRKIGKSYGFSKRQVEQLINQQNRKERKIAAGYRRVWKWLNDRKIKKNPKTVLRVMKKYELLSEIRRRRKWVSLGQQVHKYANLLDR